MNLEKIFEVFPVIESTSIVLKKIDQHHLRELFEIYDNENVFQYCGMIPKHNIQTVSKMIGHFERDYGKKVE